MHENYNNWETTGYGSGACGWHVNDWELSPRNTDGVNEDRWSQLPGEREAEMIAFCLYFGRWRFF